MKLRTGLTKRAAAKQKRSEKRMTVPHERAPAKVTPNAHAPGASVSHLARYDAPPTN
jgi:hypothetical protein